MKSFKGKMNPWGSLKDMIHGADVIIEIVDARNINETRLPVAEKWAGSKRLLVIANKSDLLPADSKMPVLQNKGIVISVKNSTGNASVYRMILDSIFSRTKSRPVRALVIGYPNVGKSSFINLLAGKKVTKVSPVAGTTKNIQWIRINANLTISDYRGLFPDKESNYELVKKGALNVQKDAEQYAYKFANQVLLNSKLRDWLEKKYDVDISGCNSSEDVLAALAKRRGLYVKGGELNIAEAARNLLRAAREAPEI